MNGRERFLTALANQKPDRLPCQVHGWMAYYLAAYLNGADQYQAYAQFAMDPVIYVNPCYRFADNDLANWRLERQDLPAPDRQQAWAEIIHTPAGDLQQKFSQNQFTCWRTEYPIKNEHDFEIWNQYVPVPVAVDWTPVTQAKKKIGDQGIVRGIFFDFGQGSPFQSFETLFGMENIIMAAMDRPDWLEHVLQSLLDKKLRAIDLAGRFELDLVETGGGAGSSTVISPSLHRRFCLPYDRLQHYALHAAGARIVYHLCGGLMPLLETVAQNGADALETMTPPALGGDCDLAQATRRVGHQLCFIGGFDQNQGFETGAPDLVKQMVFDLFAACPHGGYICCPSDHFFFGDPANLQAFADAARQCRYS